MNEREPSSSSSASVNLLPRSSAPPPRRGRSSEKDDEAIRSTDTDAALARLSAASLGYIDDPFVPLLLRDPAPSPAVRRPPWVNIGTHHRTYVLDTLIRHFLCSPSPIDPTTGERRPKQVLSLGAGSDSRFWRLRHQWADDWPVRMWVETDFEQCTAAKARAVIRNDQLIKTCGRLLRPSEDGRSELYTEHYSLIPSDLRKPLPDLPLDPNAYTLIIAELVLVYLPPSEAEACLKNLIERLAPSPVMLLSYEALDLGDGFSKVMVQNLKARGLAMAGMAVNSSMAALADRFRRMGFDRSMSIDMESLRTEAFVKGWAEELERVRRIERIDELEELLLVLAHYAVSWAVVRAAAGTGQHTVGGFGLPSL
ncbi:hypothetical protein CROQUDRAFT_674429 [Cronartium quercuum f. sp. fusiforme G11]|uniref:Leucine carboxyl methyltransferase 1 n=1 Tax=Cronartium quercuum f. sp. fusiforme G11 TaxID=708437 RepID=A0A9P6NB84_9BASI|nr:hypothetical protein CROQUDRAFT_674429 [Cronartium quercuum f. sp. fusiforme G11]